MARQGAWSPPSRLSAVVCDLSVDDRFRRLVNDTKNEEGVCVGQETATDAVNRSARAAGNAQVQ
jgi:hypothetical protein